MTRDKQLAKDVAVQLDRRRRNRRLFNLTALAGLVTAGLLYLRCGKGFGLGEGESGNGTAVTATKAPTYCTVRLSSEGLTVDGKPTKRDDAVAACKKLGSAMLTVTGDARQGDVDALHKALEDAGVKIFTQLP